MFINIENIQNLLFVPFLFVFFICWFAFCLLLILKPHAWLNFQSRRSQQYGFEWRITDEKKFVSTHRKAAFWLMVMGICLALIIAGFVTGFIPVNT